MGNDRTIWGIWEKQGVMNNMLYCEKIGYNLLFSISIDRRQLVYVSINYIISNFN